MRGFSEEARTRGFPSPSLGGFGFVVLCRALNLSPPLRRGNLTLSLLPAPMYRLPAGCNVNIAWRSQSIDAALYPERKMITSSPLADQTPLLFSIRQATAFARPHSGHVLRQTDRFRRSAEAFSAPGRYSPTLCASCADTDYTAE